MPRPSHSSWFDHPNVLPNDQSKPEALWNVP
jgi:hypothetical protein